MDAGAEDSLATFAGGIMPGIGDGFAGIGADAGTAATGVHVGAVVADGAVAPGCHAGKASAVDGGSVDGPLLHRATGIMATTTSTKTTAASSLNDSDLANHPTTGRRQRSTPALLPGARYVWDPGQNHRLRLLLIHRSIPFSPDDRSQLRRAVVD